MNSTKDGASGFQPDTRQGEPMATKKQTAGMAAARGTDTKWPTRFEESRCPSPQEIRHVKNKELFHTVKKKNKKIKLY